MKPTQLQQVVADALNVPFPTVAFHARRLREGGFLTRGGRGRSAPSMTPSDAGRLTLAVIASDGVMDSATTLQDYARFAAFPASCTGKLLSYFGGGDINALMAIEKTISGFADSTLTNFGTKTDPEIDLRQNLHIMICLQGSTRAVYIRAPNSSKIGQCAFVEDEAGNPNAHFERVHRVYAPALDRIAAGFRE